MDFHKPHKYKHNYKYEPKSHCTQKKISIPANISLLHAQTLKHQRANFN